MRPPNGGVYCRSMTSPAELPCEQPDFENWLVQEIVRTENIAKTGEFTERKLANLSLERLDAAWLVWKEFRERPKPS